MVFGLIYKFLAFYVKMLLLLAVLVLVLAARYMWKITVWTVKLPFRVLRMLIPSRNENEGTE